MVKWFELVNVNWLFYSNPVFETFYHINFSFSLQIDDFSSDVAHNFGNFVFLKKIRKN